MIWFFFFKQKTAYEMRISDWSSDVCSSDLKSGDSLKGDTPEEDMPATEEEWSLWSQDIEADLHKADRADLVNEIAQREEKRLNAASKERSAYLRGLITEKLTDFATAGDE